jgi:hypothetical protein
MSAHFIGGGFCRPTDHQNPRRSQNTFVVAIGLKRQSVTAGQNQPDRLPLAGGIALTVSEVGHTFVESIAKNLFIGTRQSRTQRSGTQSCQMRIPKHDSALKCEHGFEDCVSKEESAVGHRNHCRFKRSELSINPNGTCFQTDLSCLPIR